VAAPSPTIVDAWWTDQVDSNNNYCYESGRLNWNADVVGGGSLVVTEKVYTRRNGTTSWTLLGTTPAHTIIGADAGDTQYVDIPPSTSKGSCNRYDYKIEIYTGTTLRYTRNYQNDGDLNDHPEASPTAGLPDLDVVASEIAPTFETVTFAAENCAVVEGYTEPGRRKLLRFTTYTRNIGTGDLFVGDPSRNPLFFFSPCHAHYHFEDYADYRLYRVVNGALESVAGHKGGFCLLDFERWNSSASSSAKYDCDWQGIQVGWADAYESYLDGQWIDVTGVPTGTYTLELRVNPLGIIRESNHGNNTASVQVTLPNDAPTISDVPSVSTLEDVPTSPLSFTVADLQTLPGSLVLSASSSNPTLVPNGNVAFGGGGANRTVTVTPAVNRTGSATITVTVTDANGATDTDTFTVTVSAVNDAPLIALPGPGLTYQEGQAAQPIDATATASDADSANFSGGNLRVDFIAGGLAEDRLGVRHEGSGSGQIGVSGSTIRYGGTTIGSMTGGTSGSTPLVVTFSSSSATVAAAQALMRSIVYWNVSNNPSTVGRSVRFQLDDGDGGTSLPAAQSIAVGVLNQPPVVTLPGPGWTYTENEPAGLLDTAATVTDSDSGNVHHGRLRVEIVGGGLTGDVLGVAEQGTGPGEFALSGGYVLYEGTQIGRISGGEETAPMLIEFEATPTVTPAVAQALLRNITFRNNSENPPPGARTIRVVVNDGDGGDSAPVTKSVTVLPVNDPPTISEIEDRVMDENGVLAAIDFVVGDIESDSAALVVSGVAVPSALVPPGNIGFGGAGSDRNVVITPALNGFGSAVVTITVTDPNGGAVSEAFQLTVQAIDVDGDGYNDAEESVAGTDPLNVQDAPRILGTDADGADVIVRFHGVAGRTYRVEYNEVSPTASEWSVVADDIAGVGGAMTVVHVNGASAQTQFYRLLVWQAP
jgi:hypothetical protein